MVFNVTKDDVRVRMAAIDESVWPLPSVTKKPDADPSKRVGLSDFVRRGRKVFADVIKQFYEETNKEFETNVEPPKSRPSKPTRLWTRPSTSGGLSAASCSAKTGNLRRSP